MGLLVSAPKSLKHTWSRWRLKRRTSQRNLGCLSMRDPLGCSKTTHTFLMMQRATMSTILETMRFAWDCEERQRQQSFRLPTPYRNVLFGTRDTEYLCQGILYPTLLSMSPSQGWQSDALFTYAFPPNMACCTDGLEASPSGLSQDRSEVPRFTHTHVEQTGAVSLKLPQPVRKAKLTRRAYPSGLSTSMTGLSKISKDTAQWPARMKARVTAFCPAKDSNDVMSSLTGAMPATRKTSCKNLRGSPWRASRDKSGSSGCPPLTPLMTPFRIFRAFLEARPRRVEGPFTMMAETRAR